MSAWYYYKNNKSYGPVTIDAAKILIRGGEITADTPVKSETQEEWSALFEHEEFRQELKTTVLNKIPPAETAKTTLEEKSAISSLAPTTKQEAKPKNDSQPATSETVPAGPWKRFFARAIDFTFLSSVTGIFVIAVYFLSPDAINFSNYFLVMGIFAVPTLLILEAVEYGIFRNTIGKKLLKITILSNYKVKPTFGQYCGRQGELFVYGFGFGLPIIYLFTMLLQLSKLRKGEPTSYDNGVFNVTATKLSTGRSMAAAAVFVVTLIISALAQNAIDELANTNRLASKSDPFGVLGCADRIMDTKGYSTPYDRHPQYQRVVAQCRNNSGYYADSD